MNLYKTESWRNWLFFVLSFLKMNRNRLLRKSEDRRPLPEPGSLSSCSLSPKDRRERIEGKQSKVFPEPEGVEGRRRKTEDRRPFSEVALFEASLWGVASKVIACPT